MPASSAQVSQLVLQVDANIAVAQRSLQDLARTVQQSSGTMNTALGSTDAAITRNISQHHQLGLAYNNARIAQSELTAAVTRSVDAYGAGASPIRILSTEIGRLTEAASFLGAGAGNGVLGTIVRFMGGPWGIALLLAGSIVAKLALKHTEAKDSVQALLQKMREHAVEAANSKIADDVWAKSIDGLIDRNRKLTDEIKKRLKAEEDLDAQTLLNAQHDKATAEQALQQDRTRLANLQRQLVIAQRTNATPNAPGAVVSTTNTGQIQALQAEIAKLNEDIAKQTQGIASAQDTIKQSTIAVGEELGKAMADSSAAVADWAKNILTAVRAAENAMPNATAQISGGFNLVKKAMEAAASAKVPFRDTGVQASKFIHELQQGKIGIGQYVTAMQKLAQSLEAVAEAAKNAKKSSHEFSGNQISFAEAASIARGAGYQVNSTQRTYAQQKGLYDAWVAAGRPKDNPVAPPGTSAHEGANGKWALDIQIKGDAKVEAANLKKLFGDRGVDVHVFPERGHLHVSGSRSQAAAQDRAAAAAAKKQAVDDDAFARESAQLDAEMLQVKKQLTGDFNLQASYASQELDAQKQAQLEAIQKQVDEGQISETQAKILRAKVDELAAAKQTVIEQQRVVKSLEAQQASADQQFGFQEDDLKFADDMATTQAEHRKIQLEILDIQYKQKEVDLQILLAKQKELGDLNGAAITQAALDRLPTEKSQDQQRVMQGTLNPLEQWAKSVPHDAAAITEALQGIEAKGLDGLASAITDVITGTKSLKQAFGELAQSVIGDIIQMTIRMLIFRAISSVLGSAFGGGGFSGDPGNISVTASQGSLFQNVGFRAAGGPVTSGSPYIVGEKGPELFVPNASGMIVPNASRMSAPKAANSNNAPIELVVYSAPSDEAWAKVEVVSTSQAVKVVTAAAPTLVKASVMGTARSLKRPKLNGR